MALWRPFSSFGLLYTATQVLLAQGGVPYPERHLDLRGVVYDNQTNKPIPGAKVSLVGTDDSQQVSSTDSLGTFTFDTCGATRCLAWNTEYSILVEKEHYFLVKDQLTTSGIDINTTFTKDYYMQPNRAIACPILPMVRFMRNLSVPTAGFDSTLVLVHSIMLENPSVIMEVTGNTDFDEKQSLGLLRSQAICDRLTAMGIDRGRLTARSNGSSNPLIPRGVIKKMKDPDEVEAARAYNRTVWIKVTGTDWRPQNE